jgi:hypothetical protein
MPDSTDNTENKYPGWTPEQIRVVKMIEDFRSKIDVMLDSINSKLDRATAMLDSELAAIESAETKQ